jgi:serine/threonine protein kinase
MEIINVLEEQLSQILHGKNYTIQKNRKHGQSDTYTVFDDKGKPICIAKFFDYLENDSFKRALGESFIEEFETLDDLLDNIDEVEETTLSIEEIIDVINLQTRCFNRYIDVCMREGLECFPKVLTYLSEKKIGNTFYGVLIEDFVDGVTLDKIFTQSIDKDISVVADFLEQMGQVILKMNSNGIVHRDISPDNIMFAENRYVLIDPGMVKVEDENPTTKSTYLLGKIFYASPEQYAGYAKNVTFTSDLYAVGIIALEYILGRNPLKEIIQSESVVGKLPHVELLHKYERSIEDSFYDSLEENKSSAILFMIIKKMIQVDMMLRYDTIESYILDLRNLRERM